jgi:hypothetical protein
MLFLITVFTGIELINTWSAIRGETAGLTRHFLYGYGLMFFIIPLTFTIIFLKVRLDKRVLLSFIVMILVIMVTIYRREMVATVEYVIICAFLVAFVQNKSSFLSFSKYLNAKTILVAFSIFILLLIFSEDFLQNSLDLIHNSLVNLGLIQDGNSRIRDVRLSLTGKTGIVKAISNYFITGTGFNPIWYTGDGGENQWEGADYVFLAALAMYGIMGLLSFLPFYILVYNVGYKFVKFSKINYKLIIKSEKNLIFLIIGVACISEFVRNLIEYPNWFYPIGAIMDRGKFYIYFGLILSSYYNLKNQFS